MFQWFMSKEEADKRERAYIAKVFNDRYTYRKLYVKNNGVLPGSYYGFAPPSAGNAWMCPECNRILHPIECSVFSGLQYPACCSTEEGHRLLHGIKLN